MGLDYIALANLRENQPFFHLAVFSFGYLHKLSYQITSHFNFRKTTFSDVHFQIADKPFFRYE